MTDELESLASDEALIDDPTLRQPDGGLFEAEFWGITRHELVGGAADGFLSTAARDRVAHILEPLGQSSLRQIAGWADGVKDWEEGPPSDDAETVAFFADDRNERNGTWHYVNLPVGAVGYDPSRYPAFTRPDDVVQMTLASVQLLRGASDRFSAANALRLVAHLVGDLHQPLHIGCGYLARSDGVTALVRDPEVAVADDLPHDRGGNRLFPPISSGRNLHSYWDSQLGGAGLAPGLADAPDLRDRFVRKLRAMIRRARTAGLLGGDALAAPSPETMIVSWADEALAGAFAAYQTLEIAGPAENGDGFNLSWEGQDAYEARCGPITLEQLTKAGNNLAALLNTIWP